MPKKPTWNSGLLSCCDDKSQCCYGFFCCPCMACSTSAAADEPRCLPLCDILSPAILSACGIPLFVPPANLALRTQVRTTYGLEGNICDDILASCFCIWCSYCQIARELKHQKKNKTTVVNTQPGRWDVVTPEQARCPSPSMTDYDTRACGVCLATGPPARQDCLNTWLFVKNAKCCCFFNGCLISYAFS